jgi:hypothetical protein
MHFNFIQMKNLLLSIFVFFASFVTLSQSCTHQIYLTDTWGDGWNGGYVSVSVNGITVLSNITLSTGLGPAIFNFTASSGQTIRVWRTISGTYPIEMRVQIRNNTGTILLNTVQPTTGGSTFGGHTCIASCSGGGGGGCVNAFAFGSLTAPSIPGAQIISSCTFQSEYNTIFSVVAGRQYRSTYNLGGYITVRHTSPNGTVVAAGFSPLTWTAPVSGTYYIHYNTNSSCGTASSCGTTTIECLSCTAPTAPSNDLVCNATSISCGQLISGTTVNATNSGTGENNFCNVSQTQPGVWYVIPGNGQIMTASLCATAWDSRISVFSGPNCSSLTCVGGNDDYGPACFSTSASYSWTSVVGTNYYVLVHGYSSTSSFTINMSCYTPPPSAPTSITATQNTICNGTSTTLTANGAIGTVYWYTGGCGTTFIGTGNSITVTPSTTTTYFARNYNSGLFSSSCASTTITVNQIPQVTITPTSNVICNGSSTQLNSNVSGLSAPGNLVVTISSGGFMDETSWTLYNNLGSIIGSGGNYGTGTTNVIPIGSSANGPYTFSIETQGTWNDNTATFTITCNGTTISSGSLGGGQAFNQVVSSCTTTPPITYSWTPSTGLTNPNAPSPFASPTTNQTYTLTVTSNGCSNTTSTTITVNPSVGFVSTISGNNTIIAGTQESYSITPVPSVTYQWAYTESITAPLWINIPNSNTPSISFTWPQTTTNGSVRVMVSNASNCGNQVRFFNIITNGALPVELLSFDGSCNDNLITLNWKTATEHNSDYFDVLKSRDGENWSKLTTLNSAGNSTQELTYTTKDENAIDGNNYYKLLQYDIDGVYKEYGPINVICDGNSKGYFSIFPNPSSGDFQVVLNNKNMIGNGKLIIKDTKGSEILNKEINVMTGINLYDIYDLNIVDGIYYIQVSNGNFSTQVIKQIIK